MTATQVFRFEVVGSNAQRGVVAWATVFAPNEATARQQWEACQAHHPKPQDDVAWEFQPEEWTFTQQSAEPVDVWSDEVVNLQFWTEDGNHGAARGTFQRCKRAWETAGRPDVWCVWS